MNFCKIGEYSINLDQVTHIEFGACSTVDSSTKGAKVNFRLEIGDRQKTVFIPGATPEDFEKKPLSHCKSKMASLCALLVKLDYYKTLGNQPLGMSGTVVLNMPFRPVDLADELSKLFEIDPNKSKLVVKSWKFIDLTKEAFNSSAKFKAEIDGLYTFQHRAVVFREYFKDFILIIVGDKNHPFNPGKYFYYVCDEMLNILDDNTHDCGEDDVDSAIAIAKQVADNRL